MFGHWKIIRVFVSSDFWEIFNGFCLFPRRTFGGRRKSPELRTLQRAAREMNGMVPDLIHGCLPVWTSISCRWLSSVCRIGSTTFRFLNALNKSCYLSETFWQQFLIFDSGTMTKLGILEPEIFSLRSFQFVASSQELFKVFKYTSSEYQYFDTNHETPFH